MRGRRPKPTALKELEGNPGRRPLPAREPRPAAVEDVTPPAHLEADAQAVWRELAAGLRAVGLLTRLDGTKLEVLVIHVAEHRRLYAELTTAIGAQHDTSRLRRGLRQEAEIVRGLATDLGLDPVARTRLQVPQEAIEDEFSEFDKAPRLFGSDRGGPR